MFNIGSHVDGSPRDLLIFQWVSNFPQYTWLFPYTYNKKPFCITYDFHFADATDASDSFIYFVSPDGLSDAFLRDRINEKER